MQKFIFFPILARAMSKAELNLQPSDWERLSWQETPYPGVFVFPLHEEPNPKSTRVPLSTLIAVRVNPGCSIPLHRHNRESSWREILTFPKNTSFEIYRIGGSEQVSNSIPLILVIGAGEAFGLKNNGQRPLFFSSEMQPGFTGYEEIEEVK